jgi:phosphomannomutase
MHGVSHMFVEKSFDCFGFKPFIPVEEQQQPDPEFPTVKFPNPEEAGMPHTSFMFRSKLLTTLQLINRY